MAQLTLQPLLPWWALVLLVAPLLAFTLWQVVAAGGRGPDGARRPGASRAAWLRRTGVVVVLALIGLGPSVVSTSKDDTVTNVDMFFVVDRTGSMGAEDYGTEGDEQRLAGVAADVVSLTKDVPGARYSVIAFDSQASRQLPLTTDARAIESWTQTLHQEITLYSHGSLTDRPLDELTKALQGSQEQNPANTRLVFFLTDGEQTTDGEPRSYEDLAPLVDGGAVLGYGTDKGGRMKEYDPDVEPADAEYIKDYSETGADGVPPDALSTIDEDSLNTLADQLGVPYVHRTEPGGTASLVEGIDPEQIAADGRRDVSSYRPVVWPLALALAALLALEAWFFAPSVARPVLSRGSERPSERVRR